jgi:hypothetical protein
MAKGIFGTVLLFSHKYGYSRVAGEARTVPGLGAGVDAADLVASRRIAAIVPAAR